MSVVKVKEYFKKYGIENRIVEINETTATVAQAAKSLNTEEKRIAKSMGFILNRNKIIIIVLAGDTKVNNSKFKSVFNEKAHMIPFDEVNDKIGHPAGGVCPFAVNDEITIYLDESLKRFDTVFPACGSTNSAIELTIPELEKYSNYKEWIDVGTIVE